jgi:hypothetical protein
VRATTIRFSDPIYQRLEQASKYSGLPINAIVTAACMEWLRQQFPSPIGAESVAEPPESAALDRLLGGRRREQLPFALDARDALIRAEREARRFKHAAIGTEHVLLGIAAEETSPGALALHHVGIDAEAVQQALDFIVGRGQVPPTREFSLSRRVVQAIEHAMRVAREHEASEIDTAHLLLALCDDEESLALRIVESAGSSRDDLRAAVEAQLL